MGNRQEIGISVGGLSGAYAGSMIGGAILGPFGAVAGYFVGTIAGFATGAAVVNNQRQEPSPAPTPVPEQELQIVEDEWRKAIEEINILDMAKAAVTGVSQCYTSATTDVSSKLAITNTSKADAELKRKEKSKKLQNEFDNALKHGAVQMICGRIMMIGATGVGKSSLLKAILNDCNKTPSTKGHYPLVKLNGSFVEMTKEQEIKTLAIMARKVMDAYEGRSILKDLSSKVVVKKVLSTVRTNTTTTGPITLDAVREIVLTVKSDAFQEVQKSESKENIPTALINVSDDSWQGFVGDILPAFLTARSLFVLVFDATKIDSTVEEQIYKWIAHINDTLCLKDNVIVSIDEGLRGKQELYYPKILTVGTHGDSMSEEIRTQITKKISNGIESRFQDKVRKMGCSKIRILNCCSGDECRDTVQEAQSFIDKLQIPAPLSWELFRKAFIQANEKLNKPFLPIEEAAALAILCNIDHKGDELSSVLYFYHEHGALLHFKDVEHLCNIVISDPKWLMQQLTMLDLNRTVLPLHESEPECKLLLKFGLLVKSLCKKIWPQAQLQNLSLGEGMVNLMEKFYLAAVLPDIPPNVTNLDGPFFFTPSVLPSRPSEMPSEVSSITGVPMKLSAATLYFTFISKYVPPGCFIRLVVSLVKIGADFKINFSTVIYRDQISFIYKKEGDDVSHVTLFSTPTYISIQMERQNYCCSYKTSNFGTTCQNVFFTINKTLQEVLEKSFNSVDACPSFCCKCDQEPHPHFVPFKPDMKYYGEKLMCKSREYDLSAEEQWWLRIPEPFDKEDKVSEREISDVVEAIGIERCKQLCDCLEINMEENDATTIMIRYLAKWSDKMGNGARPHLLFHLRRLKLKTAAMMIEEPSKQHHSALLLVEGWEADNCLKYIYADLQNQLNPNDITSQLYSIGLLSKSDRDEVDNVMQEVGTRVTKLLKGVEKAILRDPENFSKFLDVLDMIEHYKPIVSKARDVYRPV